MKKMTKLIPTLMPLLIAAAFAPALAQAQDLKVALIAGKTGALEAYAKETETAAQAALREFLGRVD